MATRSRRPVTPNFDQAPYRHSHVIPFIETVVIGLLLILLMGGYLAYALLNG